MKFYQIVFALSIITLLLSVSAIGQEYNYKMAIDKTDYTFRHREGTWHIEAGIKQNNTHVMYRFADLDGIIENRIKLTQDLYKNGGFSLQTRMEYRHFDHADNYWRFRWILNYKKDIGNAEAWIKLQPRWKLDGDTTLDDARDQAGINFKFGNVKVGPFIERYAGTNLHYDEFVYGTYFTIKL